MRSSTWLIAIALFICTSAGRQNLAGQSAATRPATPVEPIAAIINAFGTHRIVALSEGEHGNEQGHTFRLALIRDPRFTAIVSDIVVECGNARYQPVVDRFVSGGEVPDAELRQTWRQVIEPGVNCDRPIYEDFIRKVRDLNRSLSIDRRLRILLGDPPVDWATIKRPNDLVPFLEARDARFPVEVIRREVLAKSRRALVIYGSGHLQRRNIGRNYEPENQIVSMLEEPPDATTVFSIWTTEIPVDISSIQPDTNSWPAPSLAMLRGTALGVADFAQFYPYGGNRAVVKDGKRIPIPRDQWRTLRMEEQFDAILHLGPSSTLTIAKLPKSLCVDSDYMQMRLGRLTLFGMTDRIDNLKRYCAEP